MIRKLPVVAQKIDFALKRLDNAISKRIQLEKDQKHRECEKLLAEIMELKRQLNTYLTEVKTLKTILRETAVEINGVIEILEKVKEQP